MLESATFHYPSRVLQSLEVPGACYVLRAGRCELRMRGIEVQEILPGAERQKELWLEL